MNKNSQQSAKEEKLNEKEEQLHNGTDCGGDTAPATDETTSEDEDMSPESQIQRLNEMLEKEKKEYLFLMAEFDNFRKRTLKEKSEIIRNGGEQVLKGILPVIDDFERGLKAAADATDISTVAEGMELIYSKLKKYLEQNGVKEINPEERDFDTERHEAISALPVADEAQKGKILDTVQKGYTLNDKILRHAKVVVGQ